MGVKWSKEQHRKYKATCERKRLERQKQNEAIMHHDASTDAVDGEPGVNQGVNLIARHPLESVREALDNYWNGMTVAEKLDAIAKYLVN